MIFLVGFAEIVAAIVTIITSLGIGSGVYWRYWVQPEKHKENGRHGQIMNELKSFNDKIEDIEKHTKETKEKVDCIDNKFSKVNIWLKLQCPEECRDQWNAIFPNDKIT